MRRLAGAVIARNHDAAVEGEAGQDGERGVAVEEIVGIHVGNVLIGGRIGRHDHIRGKAERILHRDGGVGKIGDVAIDLVHHASSAPEPVGRRRLFLTNSGAVLTRPWLQQKPDCFSTR
jgi:hypothetical protein